MCDPIIDEVIKLDYELEPFKKEMVEEYQKSKVSFDKHPLRHYSQLGISFDPEVVAELIRKLSVPVGDTKVTVFGGYTGQFADCLRRVGMHVVFTDPLQEWVRRAIDSGFQAYNFTAEEFPKELIKSTDLFATFECYQPFLESRSSIYTTLRLLTSKYGILFGESKRTREEIDEEIGVKRGRLKFSFLPFGKIYSIKRLFRGKRGLRLYHFCSNERSKKHIRLDCKIIKILYDHFPRETRVNKEVVIYLADKTKLSEAEIETSLERILDLYQLQIPLGLRSYFPKDFFVLFSKRFKVDFQ